MFNHRILRLTGLPLLVLFLSVSGAAPEAGPIDGRGANRELLYGRITDTQGGVYLGRLRFGGNEEASWSDYFNGVRKGNPWVRYVQPTTHRSLKVFGLEIFSWEEDLNLRRPFMARFGDIQRIETQASTFRVTLKSGSVVELDRFEADDLADGVRVWDSRRGAVDVDEWDIRTIEFLPSPIMDLAPARLFGTVRSRDGNFRGFLQWNREQGLAADSLVGASPSGTLSFRFDRIAKLERQGVASIVTTVDGHSVTLDRPPLVGRANRGVYVDDLRYGRVLVHWESFKAVEFGPAPPGKSYDEFPPGESLAADVITQAGNSISGRIVFDLDESETTETLDAPIRGVDYTIPFGQVAAIRLPRSGMHVEVRLNSGEKLEMERAGDLGDDNGGLLIFVDNRSKPEYLAWKDVREVVFIQRQASRQ